MERAGWPFSFSTNGDGFVFRDATLADGKLERSIGLDEFPSPAELWNRLRVWKGWIVARVTELRRLCADLRQRLDAQQTVQSHLADAFVEQALA